MNIEKEYEIVKKAYAAMGVDTDKAIEALKKLLFLLIAGKVMMFEAFYLVKS